MGKVELKCPLVHRRGRDHSWLGKYSEEEMTCVCCLEGLQTSHSQRYKRRPSKKGNRTSQGMKAGIGGTCLGKGMYPVQLAPQGQGEQWEGWPGCWELLFNSSWNKELSFLGWERNSLRYQILSSARSIFQGSTICQALCKHFKPLLSLYPHGRKTMREKEHPNSIPEPGTAQKQKEKPSYLEFP